MTDPKSAGRFPLSPLGPHLEGIEIEAKFAGSTQVDELRMKAQQLKLETLKMQATLRKDLGDEVADHLGVGFMTPEVHALSSEFVSGAFKAMLLEVHNPSDDSTLGDLQSIEMNDKVWIACRLLDMQNLRRSSFPLGEAIVRPAAGALAPDTPGDEPGGLGDDGVDAAEG